MATLVTAPDSILDIASPSLFLAGGITNCPDWQAEAIGMLEGEDVTILNPRRVEFDINDPMSSDVQIEWEHDALRLADVILFWFPGQSVCPIALYELGTWSVMDTPLVIGTHAEYQRRFDVLKQTNLVQPDLLVVDSLLMLVEQAQVALEAVRQAG